MSRKPPLKVLPPARPAVGVHASRRAARFATATIEAAIASKWNNRVRAVLLDDILAHLLAAHDDDGRVQLICPGE